MSRALKPEDILELSKLYESEFNNPDIHDRVLIFDVVASWPSRRPESEEINNEASSQSKDESSGERTELENVQEIGVNKRNKNGIHDGDGHNLNVTQETEMKLSNETDDNNIGTATDSNDATPEILCESNEAMSNPISEEIIYQHKFFIHTTWLAVQSSYFRSLFFGGIKESSSTEVHVQVSESEEQAHLMLLEAMYKIDTLDNASVDELLEVLKLAHKYDVKVVFKKAKYCLQAAAVSLDIYEKIMGFIKADNTITDVDDIESALQSFLAKKFNPLDKTWETTSFRNLSEASLRYLLSSDELGADSENTIFHALMYWIEQNGIENVLESKEMPSLLSTVRFEMISIDYLYNIVQHDAIAKKFPDFQSHYLRGISYHAMSTFMKQRLLHQLPAKRKASARKLSSPYTWVIPRDELDKLVGTMKSLKSDQFWYCGYRMVLVIKNVTKVTRLLGNQAVFIAILCLQIDNLTEQSDVTIKWQLASEAFTSISPVQKHTFHKESCMSSVNIRYKMVHFDDLSVPQQSTGIFGSIPVTEAKVTPTLPTSGFGFFAPSSKPNNAPIFGANKPTSSSFSLGSSSTTTLEGKPEFGRKPSFDTKPPTTKDAPGVSVPQQPTGISGSIPVTGTKLTTTLPMSGITFPAPSSKPNNASIFEAKKPTSSSFSLGSPSTTTFEEKPEFGTTKDSLSFSVPQQSTGFFRFTHVTGTKSTTTLAISRPTFSVSSSKPNNASIFEAKKPTSSSFSFGSPSTTTFKEKPEFGRISSFEINPTTTKDAPGVSGPRQSTGISGSIPVTGTKLTTTLPTSGITFSASSSKPNNTSIFGEKNPKSSSFSFGSSSTNAFEASDNKPISMEDQPDTIKQESPIASLSIDVKIKLLHHLRGEPEMPSTIFPLIHQ